ncbi:MAG: polysaccharide deacetylase family protein [Niabella sp.]
MLIYSTHITPRLQYIIDFIAGEISAGPWELTGDPVLFISSYKNKINYSYQHFEGNILEIRPHNLLFEENIKPQQINCTQPNQTVVFFQNESETGFDIFAAIFYLITRYEEYLPHQKDLHGRYSHLNSLAYKENFLHTPLINIWLKNFSALLISHFPSFRLKENHFLLLPTYDIDMAWSYKHKGWLRTAGGIGKELARFRVRNIAQRIRVLTGKEEDPFYNFKWLDTLHQKYELRPEYFFLAAEKTSDKDKNIAPRQPAMQQLIKQVSLRYATGLHPSWQSGDNYSILKNEKALLENITGQPVTTSRQHYLRVTFPTTYQQLIATGIKEDYSMGYAAENGFRASVASVFYWFDLSKNQATPLKIVPFCFMDATSIYYKNHTPSQALEALYPLWQEVKKINGCFCMIWHNDTFKSEDWRKMYETFIRSATAKKNYGPENAYP